MLLRACLSWLNFKVALLCGEPELANSLALRLTHSFLMTFNWQGCHEILKDCPAGVEVRIDVSHLVMNREIELKVINALEVHLLQYRKLF